MKTKNARLKNICSIISRLEETAKNEKLDLETRLQTERLILEAHEILSHVRAQ